MSGKENPSDILTKSRTVSEWFDLYQPCVYNEAGSGPVDPDHTEGSERNMSVTPPLLVPESKGPPQTEGLLLSQIIGVMK